MANSVRNLRLTTVDDLFSTEETRQAEAKQHGEQVLTVPIAEIDDFPDHPFHVVEDEAMQEMRESVKQYGVLTPAVVRKKEDAMQNKGRCMICNRMNGKDYIVYEKPKNKR